MARRAKTRVVVYFNAEPREIFSVLERHDTLQIIRRGADNHVGKDLQAFPKDRLLENHISVHRSDKSTGTTIKSSLISQGGKRTASAFIDDKETLLWGLYSEVCPILSYSRYDVQAGPKDEIYRLNVDVGRAHFSCLAYHVLVVSKTRAHPEILPYFVHRIPFSHFDLLVYRNFINLPPEHAGFWASAATRPPQIDDKVDESALAVFEQLFPKGAASIDDNSLPDYLATMNQTLFNGKIAMMIKYQAPDEKMARAMAKIKAEFTRYPFVPGGVIEKVPTPPKWFPQRS